MAVDFKYEYNDNGTWRDAFCREENDDNNKAFWFVGSDGQLHDSGMAPKGHEAGAFRDKA